MQQATVNFVVGQIKSKTQLWPNLLLTKICFKGGDAPRAATAQAVLAFSPALRQWELAVLVFAMCENLALSKVGKLTHLG
jgi:hypothetical protein